MTKLSHNDDLVNATNSSKRVDSAFRSVPPTQLFEDNVSDIDCDVEGTFQAFWSAGKKLFFKSCIIWNVFFSDTSTIGEFDGDHSDFFTEDGTVIDFNT